MGIVLERHSTETSVNLNEPPKFQSQVERKCQSAPVRIGIVNNMPDSALIATERQFTRLAQAATGGRADIRLFHLPNLPRGEDALQHLARHYRPVARLFETSLDALIVTGNEPRAPRLDDEPYWPDLVSLADWARENTKTTLWSCLAAHAAVLHLDGIERHRLPQKKSGVLTCDVKFAGALGLPPILTNCHSRLNELRRGDLLSNGYDVISEAAGGHVDVFAKSYYRSRFVFLQGHPEYEPDSLMREYRRDVGRFLRGERCDYPEIPENYFDTETTLRMENYRTTAERTRDPRLFDTFPKASVRRGLADCLAHSATVIFSNWISEVPALQSVS